MCPIDCKDLGAAAEAARLSIPEDLDQTRDQLRQLIRLLVWFQLDGWVDELLYEERAAWQLTTRP